MRSIALSHVAPLVLFVHSDVYPVCRMQTMLFRFAEETRRGILKEEEEKTKLRKVH